MMMMMMLFVRRTMYVKFYQWNRMVWLTIIISVWMNEHYFRWKNQYFVIIFSFFKCFYRSVVFVFWKKIKSKGKGLADDTVPNYIYLSKVKFTELFFTLERVRNYGMILVQQHHGTRSSFNDNLAEWSFNEELELLT